MLLSSSESPVREQGARDFGKNKKFCWNRINENTNIQYVDTEWSPLIVRTWYFTYSQYSHYLCCLVVLYGEMRTVFVYYFFTMLRTYCTLSREATPLHHYL